MVRTQIQLPEKLSKAVKQKAAQNGISVAEYVRRSLTRTVEQDPVPDREEIVRRAIAAIGCGRSGLSDVSVRHDDYLAEIYGQW